jgi:hypothetical protein
VTGSEPELLDERSQVFRALGRDELSAPEIFRRMSGSNRRTPGDQRLIYPALYGLAASWQLRARWQVDPSGITRRVYRRGRFGFLG